MKTIKIKHENVGKYTISMDGMGLVRVFCWCILRVGKVTHRYLTPSPKPTQFSPPLEGLGDL